MLRGAMVAPIARPNWMARSTAPRLSTGNTPGSARSTGEACVFGAAPKAVEVPEKILEAVDNCVCVSRPITTSHCMAVFLFVCCMCCYLFATCAYVCLRVAMYCYVFCHGFGLASHESSCASAASREIGSPPTVTPWP